MLVIFILAINFFINGKKYFVFVCLVGKKRIAFYDEKRKTIQSERCSVMVAKRSGDAQRCEPCEEHRQTLNRMLHRVLNEQEQDQDRAACSSHTNYRYLTSDDMCERLKRMHQEVLRSRREIDKLRNQVEMLIEERGANVEDDLDDHLTQIMMTKSKEVESVFEEGTFGRVFWDAQKRALSVKKLSAMRWDPVMIRWCLYLRHLAGSSAYEMLRESGAIKLPSQRTLRDYTYYTKTKSGFGDDVDQQLMEAAHIHTCPERDKYVALIMDEMHIKEDIVYDKHTGNLYFDTHTVSYNGVYTM